MKALLGIRHRSLSKGDLAQRSSLAERCEALGYASPADLSHTSCDILGTRNAGYSVRASQGKAPPLGLRKVPRRLLGQNDSSFDSFRQLLEDRCVRDNDAYAIQHNL